MDAGENLLHGDDFVSIFVAFIPVFITKVVTSDNNGVSSNLLPIISSQVGKLSYSRKIYFNLSKTSTVHPSTNATGIGAIPTERQHTHRLLNTSTT